MRTPLVDAPKALKERIELVLSESGLKAAFPGVKSLKVPMVTDHLGQTRPHFYVWVEPIARLVASSGSATCHESRIEFDLSAYLFAQHVKFDVAVETVNRWVTAIVLGVAADASLGKTVDSAIARVSDAGYDETPEKRFIAAAQIDVRCAVFSQCPSIFKELIANARSEA